MENISHGGSAHIDNIWKTIVYGWWGKHCNRKDGRADAHIAEVRELFIIFIESVSTDMEEHIGVAKKQGRSEKQYVWHSDLRVRIIIIIINIDMSLCRYDRLLPLEHYIDRNKTEDRRVCSYSQSTTSKPLTGNITQQNKMNPITRVGWKILNKTFSYSSGCLEVNIRLLFN